ASGETSRFERTHWRYPLPSRTITKAILPLDRVVMTQPATVTAWPVWPGRSRISTRFIREGFPGESGDYTTGDRQVRSITAQNQGPPVGMGAPGPEVCTWLPVG